MVQLSFLEEIKDKASRLIPTAYMDIVEECTAPHLLIPTYEHVKFLCETVTKKPEAIVDVVRALRRRIADNDVAVKHLTVQLLESIVKSSPTAFHIEVASQKGLLRDIVNVACMQPTTGRAMQAKESALLLTLNLSIWFRGHPAEECFILTTLANDVRNQLGPNCFEGIEPERNTRVRVQVAAPPARPNHRGAPAAAAAASRSAPAHRHEKRNVVDAIAVDLPTSERISAMLDVCMTFSEYLNNAEMNTERPLTEDEVVQSYLSQVRADHQYVTILLSSNLQLDRDVLRTVSDSQSALLAKVDEVATRHASRAAAPQHPQAPSTAVPVSATHHTPVRSAGDTESQHHYQPAPPPPPQQQQTPLRTGSGLGASHATPPRAEVAAGAPFAAAPLVQVQPPSVDDLFGDAGDAASMSSSNAVAAPEPTPLAPSTAAETSTAESSVPPPPPPPPSANPSGFAASSSSSAMTPSAAPAAMATETTPEEPAAEEEPAEEASAPEAHPEPEQVDTAEEEAAPAKAQREEEEEAETQAEAAPAAAEAPVAAPAAPAPAAPAPAPAPAAAATPPKDDDDFDAFLEGRMGN